MYKEARTQVTLEMYVAVNDCRGKYWERVMMTMPSPWHYWNYWRKHPG